MDPNSLTIVCCNVLAGGASRLEPLLARLVSHDPDVVCLSEILRMSAERWREALRGRGYAHFWYNAPIDNRTKGLLVASRLELDQVEDEPVSRDRWMHLIDQRRNWHLLFAHVWTGGPRPERKVEQWQWIHERVRALDPGWWLLMGDLNTGDHRDRHDRTQFTAEEQFERFGTVGVDLWRQRHGDAKEWTWLSPAARRRALPGGFRLDHAFASRVLARRCLDCRYDHSVRTNGLTDHSALIVVLGDNDPDKIDPEDICTD
ncbi:MAG: endonuclease/exonuclease/phosphatase family protein [Planctomycetes bacterium]|nr:endonuclease/exonuclease/phosphatase family protein [Planctomycetota bacterium]